jgi:hypothetical protein
MESMNPLMQSLPGLEMPVESVVETLAHMWDVPSVDGGHRMDFRASQMNLVLHFGLETRPGEALEQFETVVSFAQTYPCRIVVLCPGEESGGGTEFRGKLFSQCYIGKYLRDLCCCEALILGYSPERSDFLENQISIWLESDLPIYHWLHRVPAARIERHYLGFLKRCRKVLFDGEREGERYDAIPWPDPTRVADLAMARTLPFRQHIGQFLSTFPPAILAEGLQSIDFRHGAGQARLAWHLRCWHRKALEKCLADPARIDSIPMRTTETDSSEDEIQIVWTYAVPSKHLRILYLPGAARGHIGGDLGNGPFAHSLHIDPMSPAAVLSEALFFV